MKTKEHKHSSRHCCQMPLLAVSILALTASIVGASPPDGEDSKRAKIVVDEKPNAQSVTAEAPGKPPGKGAQRAPESVPGLREIHRGDLEDDLMLLEFYEKQPQASLDFFRAARKALDAAPMSRIADHPEIRAAAEQFGFTHLGGPMLGAVTHEGARVWVRTNFPANVTVEVDQGGKTEVFGPVASTVESDLTAVVEVTGLAPEQRYPYRVLVNGEPITMPAGASIPTAPLPGQPTKMRIVFGSCFHKSGLHNPKLLRTMRERKPTAALFYGDMAADDRENRVGLHRADYLLRDLSPAWNELAASVPLYATWDDHDYFNNDLGGVPKGFTEADREAVRQVWTQNWNNPSYGFGDKGGGVFLRTKIGPADVIMVDNRYHRGVRNQPRSFLGPEQMRWLEESIGQSSGPFVMLSCGTMWADYVSDGKDSWGQFDPEGRERIFQLIEQKNVPTFLLSGDRHGARGFKIPRPSGKVLYEFGSALLGAHQGRPAWMKDCPEQLFGFARLHAFSELEFDTTGPEPVATYRLIHEDGSELYKIDLNAKDLLSPAPAAIDNRRQSVVD